MLSTDLYEPCQSRARTNYVQSRRSLASLYEHGRWLSWGHSARAFRKKYSCTLLVIYWTCMEAARDASTNVRLPLQLSLSLSRLFLGGASLSLSCGLFLHRTFPLLDSRRESILLLPGSSSPANLARSTTR